MADVQTLREGRAGRIKVGRGLLYLEESHIYYIHGYLAKLGIECWGPNVEDSSESLWNSSCRTSALNTFRQIAASGAYDSMNFNHKYVNDLILLIQAYNHYIHFIMADRVKAEKKQQGRYSLSQTSRRNQKNQESLRARRDKFAVANDLPNRYKKIIANLHSHSDDEYDEANDCFHIKTLPYRSKACNIFFWRLDEQMKASGIMSQARKRCLPKVPQTTNFQKAPIGLPLDFYNSKWLATLPVTQQRITADSSSVAFLPDPTKSFDGEEKCGAETDDEEIEGGVIDLEVPSPWETNWDEYVGDGKWLNVYDEEEDADFEPDEEEGEEEEDDDDKSEGVGVM
ncbi:hypothetical protein O181_014013 [Austropuccinia psidii MF-1]|uniref:Uncharacterized protein n=1 Tax=Austropuccinia psidii MF-1 TaxID=1389203 RepID=A0A9Q3C0E7_9BASI|nr:hypothetical protein [Austropuccinia psidii MF-1]